MSEVSSPSILTSTVWRTTIAVSEVSLAIDAMSSLAARVTVCPRLRFVKSSSIESSVPRVLVRFDPSVRELPL